MKLAEFINNQSRSITMYKGITLGLIGIWVCALIFSFIGWLGFSPIELLLSTLVLVVSTCVASVLCGWLFGVKPQFVSSVITGLILAFIFLPTAEVPQLIMLAFAGLIAGASKFVVTWRGRHVFNPAAFAVVVISLAGLGSGAWWVATPVLTPIVLAVILVSLYQSKRWLVPGIFLAIAIPALLVQFLLFGASFPESIWLLMSWPLLFLAGIMLTEPLTLPPRKWQMYIVAAVVGVAFVLPIRFGIFQMTPAVALLLGNIVAAVFANRYAITLTFKKRHALTPTTDELVFEPSRRVQFEAGQYMELTFPHNKADFRGIRRSFSMTSMPQDEEVTFGVKFYTPSSSFKKALKTLKPGAQIQVASIGGDFVLPKDTTRPLLFVAGGIGVTPFLSHLGTSYYSVADRPDVTLVYAVSDPSEIAYRDELEKCDVKVVIVAPSKPADLPKDWKYIKGSRIDFAQLPEIVPDIAERWAYVSGPTPFVQNTSHELRKLNVRGIKHDYFVGY